MTQPTPEQAAEQLAACRYLVTAPDQETHDRLAAEASWATWAEMVPKTRDVYGVTWLVTVFAVDNDRFLTVIGGTEHKITIELAQSAEGGVFPGAWSGGAWIKGRDLIEPIQGLNGHG